MKKTMAFPPRRSGGSHKGMAQQRVGIKHTTEARLQKIWEVFLRFTLLSRRTTNLGIEDVIRLECIRQGTGPTANGESCGGNKRTPKSDRRTVPKVGASRGLSKKKRKAYLLNIILSTALQSTSNPQTISIGLRIPLSDSLKALRAGTLAIMKSITNPDFKLLFDFLGCIGARRWAGSFPKTLGEA